MTEGIESGNINPLESTSSASEVKSKIETPPPVEEMGLVIRLLKFIEKLLLVVGLFKNKLVI